MEIAPSGVRSRPVYAPLSADPAARGHLLVAAPPGLGAVLRVVSAPGVDAAPVEVYWLGEQPAELEGLAEVNAFDDPDALAGAMRQRLARAGMGLRLYVVGPEAFVWRVNLVAREAGLREDEVQREACGSRARRVFCVHCRHVFEGVTVSPAVCPGCGLSLEVRDHFSPVLAAYLGVVANAEDPTAVPEPQELFT